MTYEELIKRFKKLGKGEHYCGDVEDLFIKVAKKNEYNVNALTGEKTSKLIPYLQFKEAFDYYKFGLEAATNGKIRYIGTNDLNTIIIA